MVLVNVFVDHSKLTLPPPQKVDVGVQLEALDILCDLLSRFGSVLLPYHPSIVDAVLPQLTSPR